MFWAALSWRNWVNETVFKISVDYTKSFSLCAFVWNLRISYANLLHKCKKYGIEYTSYILVFILHLETHFHHILICNRVNHQRPLVTVAFVILKQSFSCIVLQLFGSPTIKTLKKFYKNASDFDVVPHVQTHFMMFTSVSRLCSEY